MIMSLISDGIHKKPGVIYISIMWKNFYFFCDNSHLGKRLDLKGDHSSLAWTHLALWYQRREFSNTCFFEKSA